MAAKKAGIIVILSSPSGAGKTTLVKKISLRKKYKISISHTTRKPRLNEKNGKDYFFVKNNEFKKLINNGKFLLSWIDTKDATLYTKELNEGDTWRNPPFLPHQVQCLTDNGSITEVSTADDPNDNYRIIKGDNQKTTVTEENN